MNNLKGLSPEEEQRLRPAIDPATQILLKKHTTDYSLTLEIGCGPGQYRLAVNGAYVGVDLTAKDYNETLPRTTDVIADAMALPFKANTFDVAFYSNTFYHFGNYRSALSEVRRILQPNGKILIFDYSQKTLIRVKNLYRQSCPGWEAHVRDCADWLTLLKEAGFSQVSLWGKSFSRKQRLLRLLCWGWLLPLYFAIIDACEGSIFVMGTKPAPAPGSKREQA